jgi:hypothetical protein
MYLRVILAAIVSVLMIAGAQAQEGARAYFPVPAGTNDVELTGTFVHSEAFGVVADSATLTPTYRRALDLGGDAGTFLIGIPFGKVSGTVSPLPDEDTGLGQGDLFIGGTVGLINAPALSPQGYVQYQPGFSASAVGRVFLPTGAYDENRVLNLGGNRWSFEAMLPMSFMMGSSLVDPNLTTFEIIPSVQIFGDNNDPFKSPFPVPPTKVTSQAPLFGVEAHVTHSFSPAVWGALDAYGKFGGENSADGVGRGDGQQSVALGATLGLTLSQSVALRLSYQQQVYSKTPNTDSRTFMATTAFLF